MFGTIEAQKEKLKIQEYSIAQTSLEQIFNQFAATVRGRVSGSYRYRVSKYRMSKTKFNFPMSQTLV